MTTETRDWSISLPGEMAGIATRYIDSCMLPMPPGFSYTIRYIDMPPEHLEFDQWLLYFADDAVRGLSAELQRKEYAKQEADDASGSRTAYFRARVDDMRLGRGSQYLVIESARFDPLAHMCHLNNAFIGLKDAIKTAAERRTGKTTKQEPTP